MLARCQARRVLRRAPDALYRTLTRALTARGSLATPLAARRQRRIERSRTIVRRPAGKIAAAFLDEDIHDVVVAMPVDTGGDESATRLAHERLRRVARTSVARRLGIVASHSSIAFIT